MSKSKKRNKAVALKYNVEEDLSPIVIAAGYGEVAGKIIDVAEKQGIPVFRDDTAVSLLCTLDIGRNIPTDLYSVVAAIYIELLDTSQKLLESKMRGGNSDKSIRPRSASTRPRRALSEQNINPDYKEE